MPPERDLFALERAAAVVVGPERRQLERRIHIRQIRLEVDREGIGFALLDHHRRAAAKLGAEGPVRRKPFAEKGMRRLTAPSTFVLRPELMLGRPFMYQRPTE